MSKGIIDTIIGGIEIAAGVALEIISGGLNPLGYPFMSWKPTLAYKLPLQM